MKPRYFLLIALAVALGGGIWTLVSWRNQPPEVPFTRVLRESVASTVPTNGKVEPIEWAEARAERAGPVDKILIARGQEVKPDAPLVELGSAEARADLVAAQARVSQVRADLDVIERGGHAVDLADISSSLDRTRLDLTTAQHDYDALKRLEAKQAATPLEVAQAKDRIDRAELQLKSLEQRRASLVAAPDRASAEARLREAQAAVTLAQERIQKSVIRAPIGGTVYQFDLRPGAYLNAGDVVATIGQLSRVRVKVFVDEPDLGRVSIGMPVSITWDAMPSRQWKGVVDRTPTQIVPLGTRQVGEVACVIENPKNELLPGTNVNVDILSQKVTSALTIPKEAVRRENGQTGVYVLNGQTLAWKRITLGISNTTRTQVDGLGENEAVAMPFEKPLKNGMIVNPVYP